MDSMSGETPYPDSKESYMAAKTTAKAAEQAQPLLTLDGFSNAEVLNTVRKFAGQDYQSRIPVATQSNIDSIFQTMNEFMPLWDTFWGIFVQRIGRTIIENNNKFSNPLAPFKRNSLNYGSSVQEVTRNLIRAKNYDANDINVFGRDGREPEIAQAFHQQNRQNKYELNIPMEPVLQGSFINGESLAAFSKSLLEVPIDSNANDEYLLMRQLFSEYAKRENFFNIHVDDIQTADNRRDAINKLVEAVRATNTKWRFNSTWYSPIGREREWMVNSGENILIIDANTEAALGVQSLAYSFNMEESKFVADHLVVLDTLGPELAGYQALLVDVNFFMVLDTLSPTMLQSPLNPSNISYNYFYHIWQILSYSRFVNAASFSILPDTDVSILNSTVTGVTLTDAEGGTDSIMTTDRLALTATVNGTNSPNQAVRWEIKAFDGAGHGLALNATTFIDSLGVFHRGSLKSGDVVDIVVTSLQDERETARYRTVIQGEVYVEGASVSPATVSIEKGSSANVAVTITPSGSTDKTYRVLAADKGIATAAPTSTGLTIAGVSVGTTEVVVIANGTDPRDEDIVSATVRVTVTEPDEEE